MCVGLPLTCELALPPAWARPGSGCLLASLDFQLHCCLLVQNWALCPLLHFYHSYQVSVLDL